MMTDDNENSESVEDGEEEQDGPTAEQTAQYDLVFPLLQDLHGQFTELSKKKPDATVSKMKVSIANRLLVRCRLVLADEAELEFLDLLEDASLPQTSDVLIVISQYLTALKEFRSRYHYADESNPYHKYWHTVDGSVESRRVGDDEDEDADEDEDDKEEDEDDR